MKKVMKKYKVIFSAECEVEVEAENEEKAIHSVDTSKLPVKWETEDVYEANEVPDFFIINLYNPDRDNN
jgi:hypothetical protein